MKRPAPKFASITMGGFFMLRASMQNELYDEAMTYKADSSASKRNGTTRWKAVSTAKAAYWAEQEAAQYSRDQEPIKKPKAPEAEIITATEANEFLMSLPRPPIFGEAA